MSTLPEFDKAIVALGYRAGYAQKLRDIAATCGYRLSYSRYNRDALPAKKPWHILYGDGTLVASFSKLDKLETNLRGRCGC